MNAEPRTQNEYDSRQTEAARRVLVDVGQVLAAFEDCLVLVGGWVPDLLLPNAEEPHVGSIDVDLALDAERLMEGRYAELLGQLLRTGRYRLGAKSFQLLADVDLADGGAPVRVEVEFLASKEVKLEKNKPKLLEGFRVLQADACGAAFRAPVRIEIAGRTLRGARNKVRLRVGSLVDFLVMKAHALGGRDKPKNSYDLCYCLDHFPGRTEAPGRCMEGARRRRGREAGGRNPFPEVRKPGGLRPRAGGGVFRLTGGGSPGDAGSAGV